MALTLTSERVVTTGGRHGVHSQRYNIYISTHRLTHAQTHIFRHFHLQEFMSGRPTQPAVQSYYIVYLARTFHNYIDVQLQLSRKATPPCHRIPDHVT